MVDFGGISTAILSWVSSLLFWGLALFIFLVVSFLFIKIRKKRKLKIPTIEVIDLGNGKVAFNTKLKSGWFKSKRTFFGLYDYGGEDVCETSDGRLVLEASSEDYHDINRIRGLIVRRKSDDPRVLIPVSEFELDEKSREALMTIAPADFRDASSKLVARTENEMVSKFEKYLPWISLMLIGIIMLIMIVVIVQYAKGSQKDAINLVLEVASRTGQNPTEVAPSYAP